jgi:tRNA uridine 5-carbamoylmethylation protein Kti12
MKTLIMLSAVPAAGKTTWAKKYQEEHENVYIINSDDVRLEITGGNYQDHSRQKEVWELFERRIHEYAKLGDNVTVILDALNDVNPVRLKYLSTTPEYDKKILVLFPTTLDKSMKYNGERPWPNKVPDDILVQLNNKFEEPSKEVLDLVDEVITIKW